jgi:broad specificity phosphatase PhoE
MESNFINKKYKIIWIESICDIPSMIENNIIKTKINSPDYKNWGDPEKAAEDFRNRINEYVKIYQTLSIKDDGANSCFIKLINQGDKMIIRNVKGYVESKIISYLTNLHTGDRPIYFLAHGESENDKLGVIGGDSPLSEKGLKFCELLKTFFEKESESFYNNNFNLNKGINNNNFDFNDTDRNNNINNTILKIEEKPQIFCSTIKSSIQTAEYLSFLNSYKSEKLLNEINTGFADGISIKEFSEKFPKENEERKKNKLYFRFEMGESYMDVIQRIEPVIFEMERIKSPIIVVGHLKMLRCLYGYFAKIPIENIPSIKIPLHYVIKFVPEAYGFYETRFEFDLDKKVILKDDRDFVSDLDS